MPHATHSALATLLTLAIATTTNAQVFRWINPADSDWFDAARWDALSFPDDPAADVLIDLPGEYTITMSGFGADQPHPPVLANSLSILEPDATLEVQCWYDPFQIEAETGYTLQLGESLHVDGLLTLRRLCLNGSSPTIDLENSPHESPIISGSGEIRLRGGRVLASRSVLPETLGVIVETSGFIRFDRVEGPVRVTSDASSLFMSLGVHDRAIEYDPGAELGSFTARIGLNLIPLAAPPNSDSSFEIGVNAGPVGLLPGSITEAEIDFNAAPITVHPGATLDARFGRNLAIIHIAQGSDITLSADHNERNITAAPGATLRLAALHNEPGVVVDVAGATLDIAGPYTGGILRNSGPNRATIRNLADVVIESDFDLTGDLVPPGFTNNARLDIASDLELIDGDVTIDGHGELAFPAFAPVLPRILSAAQHRLTIGPDQTLAGSAIITTPVLANGSVSPGDDATPGEFRIFRLFDLEPSATVLLDVFAAAEHDRLLAIVGLSFLSLDGDLVLRFHGDPPPLGSEFGIIIATARSGAFRSVTTQGLPDGQTATLIDRGSVIDARITNAACLADLAEPAGVLDFIDVLNFLSAFGNAEPQADLSPPQGVFDFADVLAYLTAFAAGCP